MTKQLNYALASGIVSSATGWIVSAAFFNNNYVAWIITGVAIAVIFGLVYDISNTELASGVNTVNAEDNTIPLPAVPLPFFEVGKIYTEKPDTKVYKAPELLMVFQCTHVTKDPSLGTLMAFGWVSNQTPEVDSYYPGLFSQADGNINLDNYIITDAEEEDTNKNEIRRDDENCYYFDSSVPISDFSGASNVANNNAIFHLVVDNMRHAIIAANKDDRKIDLIEAGMYHNKQESPDEYTFTTTVGVVEKDNNNEV